jgi:hypothetical protein
MALDPANYRPAVAELLRSMPLAPLGPGAPDATARDRLAALEDAAFDGTVLNRDMLAACRAGLWLAFNFLDESHTISQGVETAEGSFWHAIMHRREPDPSNSKYWFRKVGGHPVIEQLREQARAIGCAYTGPFDFVDLAERVRGSGGPDEEQARRLQRLEWELLFDHCFRGAVGSGGGQ